MKRVFRYRYIEISLTDTDRHMEINQIVSLSILLIVTFTLSGCVVANEFDGDPSTQHVGESFGEIELRNNQILLEVNEVTFDWVRVIAPDGWRDKIPVAEPGTGRFSRPKKLPEGTYRVVGLASGKLGESPYPVETHNVTLSHS